MNLLFIFILFTSLRWMLILFYYYCAVIMSLCLEEGDLCTGLIYGKFIYWIIVKGLSIIFVNRLFYPFTFINIAHLLLNLLSCPEIPNDDELWPRVSCGMKGFLRGFLRCLAMRMSVSKTFSGARFQGCPFL